MSMGEWEVAVVEEYLERAFQGFWWLERFKGR